MAKREVLSGEGENGMVELKSKMTPDGMTFLIQLFREFKDIIDYKELDETQKAAYKNCCEVLEEAEKVWSKEE
jgi:hypothetical protein